MITNSFMEKSSKGNKKDKKAENVILELINPKPLKKRFISLVSNSLILYSRRFVTKANSSDPRLD